MYSPTNVSVGPIRSQKSRGVRKVRKLKTKRRRKGRQFTKRKISVNKLIRKKMTGSGPIYQPSFLMNQFG